MDTPFRRPRILRFRSRCQPLGLSTKLSNVVSLHISLSTPLHKKNSIRSICTDQTGWTNSILDELRSRAGQGKQGNRGLPRRADLERNGQACCCESNVQWSIRPPRGQATEKTGASEHHSMLCRRNGGEIYLLGPGALPEDAEGVHRREWVSEDREQRAGPTDVSEGDHCSCDVPAR